MRFDIIDVVAYLTNIKRRRILSSCRKQEVCDARVIIANFYKSKGYSLHQIGRILNRDHSTIVWQLQVYNNLYSNDKSFRNLANKVMDLDTHCIQKFLAYGEESICEVEECESR